MKTATLKVKGMTCSGCATSVKRVLQQIDGVSRVDVALQAGQATVEYDPALADPARFEAAIRDAGYEAG